MELKSKMYFLKPAKTDLHRLIKTIKTLCTSLEKSGLNVFYRIIQTIIPLQLRFCIKKILSRANWGNNFLQFLEQRHYFAQGEIKVVVHGYELLLPTYHPLPRILAREPFRENLLANASRILLQRENDKFIDVGANIGFTAAVLFAHANKNTFGILIEPSQFFLEFLKENSSRFPKFKILESFINFGDSTNFSQNSLHHWGGTARFIQKISDGKSTDSIKPINLNSLIDKNVKLVKIDCDGLDFKILHYTIPQLKGFRPAFHYENDIRSIKDLTLALDLLDVFERAGYKYVIAVRNCGILLYSGLINDSLKDLFMAQYFLHEKMHSSAIPYTDILIFNSNQKKQYLEVLYLIRETQQFELHSIMKNVKNE